MVSCARLNCVCVSTVCVWTTCNVASALISQLLGHCMYLLVHRCKPSCYHVIVHVTLDSVRNSFPVPLLFFKELGEDYQLSTCLVFHGQGTTWHQLAKELVRPLFIHSLELQGQTNRRSWRAAVGTMRRTNRCATQHKYGNTSLESGPAILFTSVV